MFCYPLLPLHFSSRTPCRVLSSCCFFLLLLLLSFPPTSFLIFSRTFLALCVERGREFVLIRRTLLGGRDSCCSPSSPLFFSSPSCSLDVVVVVILLTSVSSFHAYLLCLPVLTIYFSLKSVLLSVRLLLFSVEVTKVSFLRWPCVVHSAQDVHLFVCVRFCCGQYFSVQNMRST